MQTTRECATHEVAFLCNTHLSQQPVTNWSGNTHLTDQSPGLCDQGPKKMRFTSVFGQNQASSLFPIFYASLTGI